MAFLCLANGKVLGIDGFPVEFYRTFWPILGKDMLNLEHDRHADSFKTTLQPLGCKKAVITLLPKMENWKPVSLWTKKSF